MILRDKIIISDHTIEADTMPDNCFFKRFTLKNKLKACYHILTGKKKVTVVYDITTIKTGHLPNMMWNDVKKMWKDFEEKNEE